jgi:hypothetical protein
VVLAPLNPLYFLHHLLFPLETTKPYLLLTSHCPALFDSGIMGFFRSSVLVLQVFIPRNLLCHIPGLCRALIMAGLLTGMFLVMNPIMN